MLFYNPHVDSDDIVEGEIDDGPRGFDIKSQPGLRISRLRCEGIGNR